MQSSATDPPPLNGSILEDGSGHEARGAMARKRHKPKLRRVEVLRGQGRTMAPDRRFRADLLQLGGMSRDRLRQWKDLQKKDRLRKAVADPTLEADPDGDSTRRLFSPSPCRACIDQVRTVLPRVTEHKPCRALVQRRIPRDRNDEDIVARTRFQKYLPLYQGGWQPAESLAA